jgi:hypothetical protein
MSFSGTDRDFSGIDRDIKGAQAILGQRLDLGKFDLVEIRKASEAIPGPPVLDLNPQNMSLASQCLFYESLVRNDPDVTSQTLFARACEDMRSRARRLTASADLLQLSGGRVGTPLTHDDLAKMIDAFDDVLSIHETCAKIV